MQRIFLIVLIFQIYLTGSAQMPVDSVIQLAEARISVKAYESALVYLQDIEGESNDIRVFLLLAKVNALLGNFDIAEQKVKDAETVDPNSVALIYQKAEIFYLKGDEKEAIRILNKAIDEFPENGDLYYYRGLLYNLTGKYSRSIPDFETSLELNTSIKQYKIHLNKAIAHSNLMEYEEALIDNNEAVDLAGNIALVYHARGMVYYKMRRYDEAVEDFSKAVEMDSGNPETIFNLGMTYFRMEVFNEACVYFHRACQLGNNNACKMVIMECGQN